MSQRRNIIAARAKMPPTAPPIIAPNFEVETWLPVDKPPSAPEEAELVADWENIEVSVKTTTLPLGAVDVDVMVLVLIRVLVGVVLVMVPVLPVLPVPVLGLVLVAVFSIVVSTVVGLA